MSGNQPPPPPFGNQPPQPPQPPGGGYGGPPQPPGGYGGPPPGGGYGGPPPGGGYGGPPPGGGYGGGPMGAQPWDVGSAVSYAWAKFQQNTGQMILAALAIFLGALVIIGLGFVLVFVVLAGDDTSCSWNASGTEYNCDTGGAGFFLTMAIFALTFGLFFIYAQVVGAGLIRSSLGVTEGRPFRTSEVFKFTNLGPVIVTALIIGAGIMVGYVLCIFPAIIFGFLTQYSLYFLIDKNLSPVESIKASINLVKDNLGTTIIWYLVSAVIILVGELLCGVGLLVAIPVVLVGTAYTYKKLTGQAVAA